MKRLPKYTPAEVRNDPYGFTYKEMSEVIGENEAKALYEELYKQLPRKKNLSMLVKIFASIYTGIISRRALMGQNQTHSCIQYNLSCVSSFPSIESFTSSVVLP